MFLIDEFDRIIACRSVDEINEDEGGWLELEFEPPDGLVDEEPGDEDDDRSPLWAG